jgi:signal transduction histidine kinase
MKRLAFFSRLSLYQRFMLAGLVVLLLGMIGVGLWVGQEIQAGVVRQTSATTALYVNSFVSPYVQELATDPTLTPDHIKTLQWLLKGTDLGKKIIAFKVWDTHGRVVYSTAADEIGKDYPLQGGLQSAVQGQVASQVSDLEKAENVDERQVSSQLLETYSPVWQRNSSKVVAVAEFYQSVADLESGIRSAQLRSWLVVGGATLVMYLLLGLFVKQASDTIQRQQEELSQQVRQLEVMGERVRRAAARTTALNERFLRRVSAELHDGPAQDLGLALLQLDNVIAETESGGAGVRVATPAVGRLSSIESAVRHALQEIRGISSGMGLPQLAHFTVAETVERAVRSHERRTSTPVDLVLEPHPEQAPLPVKITLYRVIQEALTNSYRHAAGAGQQVKLAGADHALIVEISDRGPGLNGNGAKGWNDDHLGLMGMRERVESLGGTFTVESPDEGGVRVTARLPLSAGEENGE